MENNKNLSIAIGISTYNRKDLLKKLIESVRNTSEEYIFVSDDGSTDGTQNMLQELEVDFIGGENKGVAINKNRLFRKLKDFDCIFILEDDLIIQKSGWVKLFVNAYIKTGINHFLFCPKWYFGKPTEISVFDDITVDHPPHDGGVFSFYTKKIVEICGGMDPRFSGCGWGHCDFTERIHRAGLSGKYKINHLRGSEDFLNFTFPSSHYTKKEKDTYQKANMDIWKDNRKNQTIKTEL